MSLFWMKLGGALMCGLVASSGVAWAQGAAEPPIMKCPEARKNCAVGIIVESGKSYTFRIFQASEEILVGKRRQLAATPEGQKIQSLDLGPLNGRVLVLEYDESDKKTLRNVRIITTTVAGR